MPSFTASAVRPRYVMPGSGDHRRGCVDATEFQNAACPLTLPAHSARRASAEATGSCIASCR